eukprot:11239842-Alexandrium_andersonii.AAC.1
MLVALLPWPPWAGCGVDYPTAASLFRPVNLCHCAGGVWDDAEVPQLGLAEGRLRAPIWRSPRA